MEQIDPQKAQRVWQRVRGEEPANAPLTALQSLAAAEWTQASAYLLLSRQMQGEEKELLRKLSRQEREHGACLRGIHAMATGEPLSARGVPPEAQTPEAVLRKCYSRTLRAAGEYEKRSTDPEYGCVFEELARQERAACRMILQILGNLQR